MTPLLRFGGETSNPRPFLLVAIYNLQFHVNHFKSIKDVKWQYFCKRKQRIEKSQGNKTILCQRYVFFFYAPYHVVTHLIYCDLEEAHGPKPGTTAWQHNCEVSTHVKTYDHNNTKNPNYHQLTLLFQLDTYIRIECLIIIYTRCQLMSTTPNGYTCFLCKTTGGQTDINASLGHSALSHWGTKLNWLVFQGTLAPDTPNVCPANKLSFSSEGRTLRWVIRDQLRHDLTCDGVCISDRCAPRSKFKYILFGENTSRCCPIKADWVTIRDEHHLYQDWLKATLCKYFNTE